MLYFGLGANMLPVDVATLRTQPGQSNPLTRWQLISPIQVSHMFNHRAIDVLKMDCEGCEFAIARDVALHQPRFFSRVGQFAIELHLSKFFASTDEHIHYLGLLFYILEREGLILVDARIERLHPKHESYGCDDKLVAANFPCGKRQMGHNYLFARTTKVRSDGNIVLRVW